MLKRIFYWVLTALLAAWLVTGGIFDSTHAPAAMALLHKLGYPDYLASFLGVCKLLAVPALLYPPARLLREWPMPASPSMCSELASLTWR